MGSKLSQLNLLEYFVNILSKKNNLKKKSGCKSFFSAGWRSQYRGWQGNPRGWHTGITIWSSWCQYQYIQWNVWKCKIWILKVLKTRLSFCYKFLVTNATCYYFYKTGFQKQKKDSINVKNIFGKPVKRWTGQGIRVLLCLDVCESDLANISQV